jgi:GTP-binding protein
LSVQASPSIGIRAREVVIADIPGLIEGASQGKGLGLQFLRHIERCQVLLFLLSWDETLLYDEDMKNSEKITKLWSSYQVLLEEMKEYNSELLDKPQVIALNKIEIISEDLQQEAVIFFKKQGLELMLMSGITGKGLPAVTNALLKKLD